MSSQLVVGKTQTACKKKTKQRWSKNQFIVWAFNFIVGYGFVISLNGTFKYVGNFLPVVLVIGAIISFITGFSYVRLSRSFVGDGGAFLYAKKNIKSRFVVYSTGFWQYAQGPTVGVSSFFGILWAFSNIFAKNGNAHTSADISHYWYISTFSAVLFGLIFILLTKGFIMKKYALYTMYVLKWSMLILAMLIALASAKHFASNIVNSYGHGSGIKGTKISDLNIVVSVISFFFAFGGFEGVAVVGNDVENSKKNLGRTLVICLCLTTFAYIVIWFLMIGSVGVQTSANQGFGGSGDFNPINVLLSKLIYHGNNGAIKIGGRVGAGVIFILVLLLISEIANKSSSRFMNGSVNARILVVLARSGFLPRFFLTKNKNKQYINALGVDFVLIYIIFIIFYITFLKTQFKLTDVLDLYTVLTFMQYIFVLFIAIKFYMSKTKEKWKKVEVFGYVFCSLILSFFLIIYELVGIITFVKDPLNTKSGNFGVVIIAGTLLLLFIFSLVLYGVGYMRRWHRNDHNLLGHLHIKKPHLAIS